MHALMADPPKKPVQRRASLVAYAQGRRACLAGRDIDENPYPIGKTNGERRSWFSGYLLERTKLRLGHILEKYPE